MSGKMAMLAFVKERRRRRRSGRMWNVDEGKKNLQEKCNMDMCMYFPCPCTALGSGLWVSLFDSHDLFLWAFFLSFFLSILFFCIVYNIIQSTSSLVFLDWIWIWIWTLCESHAIFSSWFPHPHTECHTDRQTSRERQRDEENWRKMSYWTVDCPPSFEYISL